MTVSFNLLLYVTLTSGLRYRLRRIVRSTAAGAMGPHAGGVDVLLSILSDLARVRPNRARALGGGGFHHPLNSMIRSCHEGAEWRRASSEKPRPWCEFAATKSEPILLSPARIYFAEWVESSTQSGRGQVRITIGSAAGAILAHARIVIRQLHPVVRWPLQLHSPTQRPVALPSLGDLGMAKCSGSFLPRL